MVKYLDSNKLDVVSETNVWYVWRHGFKLPVQTVLYERSYVDTVQVLHGESNQHTEKVRKAWHRQACQKQQHKKNHTQTNHAATEQPMYSTYTCTLVI